MACSLFGTTNVFAAGATGEELTAQYNLNPSSKAERQWKKIFKKERRMKLLGINSLSENEKEVLLKYLIKNAADAERATVPGQ